jgi:transcriptional regulator with XRE-family HTH domain
MIGLRIAALRKRAGMSQRELAGRLGVSASAVGMYEQGRREPSAEKLVRLSQLLEVSVDYLLTGAPVGREDRAAVQAILRRTMGQTRNLTVEGPDGVRRPVDRETVELVLAVLLGD